MRILMVNKFLYPRGGAESYVLDVGRQLEAMGNQVEYFGMYDPKNVVGNELDLYTNPMDFHRLTVETVTYPFHLIYNQDAYKKMKAICASFHPDIVHLNNFNYQLTPSVIDAAKDCNIPVIMTAHDSQLVCANHLLYNPNVNTICTLCIDKKDSTWCRRTRCIHGSYAKSAIGTYENLYYRSHDTYNWISTILCPSKFMKGIYDRDERFKNKTFCLQNYVVPVEKNETAENTEKGSYFLYFGRLSPEKGIRNLLKATKAFPDEMFYIAGSGPLEKEVVDASQGSNIRFLGFKSKKELSALIENAKCVVLPSTCYENCPLSVMEAQQLHVPVLAPAYGGAAELTYAKYQIRGTSEQALEEAITRILQDPYALQVMADDSVFRASCYMRLDTYCKTLHSIYTRTCLQSFCS